MHSPLSTEPVASSTVPEPAGEGQSLPAAGLLAGAAASQSPPPDWLRAYLTRALAPSSLPKLRDGARNALIEQAVEVAAEPNPVATAADVLHGYLSAANFAPRRAVPLVSSFLQADLAHSTVYDARAREALMRMLSALRLPPRVLYTAEAELAALVHAVAANATASGKNVESVAEDPQHARRRSNMKWLKVGAASVVGGLALGLSGGLIAPALLPALGTVGLTTVSGSLAALGGGGAVAVGGIFGAAGAGVGAAAMASRTGSVEDFHFERCTVLPESRSADYESIRITPSKKIREIVVPIHSRDKSVVGGLLVWEFLARQEFSMVVPGRMAFGIQFQGFSVDGQKARPESLVPEEEMDVGGLDKTKDGKRKRITGAITVQENGLYTLRFRLLPGSLAVALSYRVAHVPPGKDPPLWVMEENENLPSETQKSDMRSLSLAILIPGLINAGENGPYPGICADQFTSTARAFADYDIQSFALRWDTELLVELSDALNHLMSSMAISMAAQNGVNMIVPAVVGAVALPVSIIGALRTLIGNIWAKTISHASECGYMLAAELASRSFGNRPVILAGYSAGAMVIFSCLQELARRGLVGIIHDVYLIGAPCTAAVKTWREIRSVVAGRLVNAYNPNDWYLELYHRSTNLGAVAGTRSIQDPDGIANVENICLTGENAGTHMDYAKRCGRILLDIAICDAERRRPWSTERNLSEVLDEHERKDGDRTNEDAGTVEPAPNGDEDIVVFRALRPNKHILRARSVS